MVSKEQRKRASLHENLQLLRSITNSHASSMKSIISDASNYIGGLQQRIERLNEEIAYQTASRVDDQPQVTVETLEKGFVVSVFSEKSYPGLLVSVLEFFEGLGLEVLEATASCTEYFRLRAVGAEEDMETLQAEEVKQAVQRAIKWCQENE
ncbi:hypothetical protein HPP92_003295 [Vanilla planifolia]|uniref:Plant bHLH transcription factor ACT-like domain-containing protein n=1 Tax=Vanilla planifolia TaxID=51239 RepID=A0A835SGD3_VANPL|nr:hypothetical protein HPP92_003295 [Vanilla planifolia]